MTADLLEELATIEASGEVLARTTDPTTSHEAAASLTRDTRTETQRAIVRLLHRHGPMTDAEIADRYFKPCNPAVSESGLRTRRSELVRDGHVVDTRQRRTLASGRKATVWGLA